ncbi:hypothetical protein GN244_ATG04843 [Phytophthora infestans]|uniref:Uncharacterized protein n=1 Tax=Phytophthora infestans TaxID=4787 RepID=A0A833T5U1_PHYIN|nr:hypothetical protein GN244_ATG04843 [Phytophthora infestans]
MDPGIMTDPCTVCGKGVHHICANEVYTGELSTTSKCRDTFTAGTVSAPIVIQGCDDTEDEDESQGTTIQLAQLSARSSDEPSQIVDIYGIPTSVKYVRQNGPTPVWDYIRRLRQPVKASKSDKSFTHICLVCAEETKSRKLRDPDSWMSSLCRIQHSTNAWKHLAGQHPCHPLVGGKTKMKVQRSEKTILSGERAIESALGKRVGPVENTRESDKRTSSQEGSTKIRIIADHFRVTSRQAGVVVFKWLARCGYPYNIVTTPAFKLMIQSLTCNLDI